MIALVELLPTVVGAVMAILQGLGITYVVWKLESRGAADKIVDATGNVASAVGGAAQSTSELGPIVPLLLVGGLIVFLGR